MSPRALVVGAGPAGLGAAARLAAWCDTVTVVDAQPRNRRRCIGEHLPPAGLTELAALGLGALIDDQRHDPSPGVRSSWGDNAIVDKEYFTGLPGHGLNLRRAVFDEALAQHATRRGARLRFATRLHSIGRHARGWTAILANGAQRRCLEADLVVDATGRCAAVARRLGAIRRRLDRMVALVGRVERCASTDEPGRVHVESVEDGWWYGVSFSDASVLAVFMTDADGVSRYDGGPAGLWRVRLAQSRLLAPLVSRGDWSGAVEAFDAATQWLDYDPQAGFLAVGDAAAAYDPLSSWGITKALCDGAAGADALAQAYGGAPRALEAHRDEQLRAFRAHCARQQSFYAAETRWSAAPFWRSHQLGTRLAGG